MVVETVWLETIDGVSIEADLIRTDRDTVKATVVIGHPHPLHGGDRHNPVVRAIQAAASELGCHSIAVDFRGVGLSGGVHDDGDSERLDLAAACELADMVEADCPIVMAGYSFGSVVGLNVSNPWIAGWLAVAPPLAMTRSTPIAAGKAGPKVIIAPEHDQFTDHPTMLEATSGWMNTTVIQAVGVDHFFSADAPATCLAGLRQVLDKI